MIRHFLRGICSCVRGIFRSEQGPAKASWKLVPLTPEYLEEEHGGYVAAIEAALANDQIRNIALSGNYGVGKSSIMREVARRQGNRIVELSLSTLAPIEPSQLDDSVPIQATTPTNRIQQEIVKQLLYREYPSRTPGSRFRRIERFRWLRTIGTSVLLGFIVGVIFLLTGWTLKIASELTPYVDIGDWAHPVIWGGASLIILLVNWLFYGKLHIQQLSAGAATVTLSESSVSYFDQYLDEIVYFFEVSGRDIVLFEDIDRFNDSHIFETLRALNTLLNASPQIERPIRFIYAIKDSIFDRIGLEIEGRVRNIEVLTTDDPAQVEAIRANRTKFFDLVIPVVPFITHRSARNLVLQLLSQVEHKVAPELLDLAAQYVPDMRLLKNVRNEFIVFRDRIFSGDGKQLNLNETDLFAMMLYKSTHLADFETIRLGHSKLDTLYKVGRELVTENIKRFEGERRVLLQQIARINGAATRSARLGERLLAHVQRTAQAAGYRTQRATYLYAGESKSPNDLKGAQFWTSFVSADGDSPLQWRNDYGQTLSFSRDNLKDSLGDPLDAESWGNSDHDALTEQIDEKTEDIKFLRSADLGDLIKRPEFLVQYKGSNQSLEVIAKMILTPGLAYQIVRAGYINRNFTLYTSTFHGDRVGSAATNFIIHHVERDMMDEHFELTSDDVDAVVRERGKNTLKDPALYNIAILDRLLAADLDAADIMIHSLVGLEKRQASFLKAYLTAGNERLRFIERFTVASPRVLTYLVGEADIDDASRLEMVDVALACLTSSKQRTDSAVSSYLSAHYAEFKALTSNATVPLQAERIGVLFGDAGITVPRLEPLGQHTRTSFVSRNLYDVTYQNLAIAIDNTATLALDIIRASNQKVYGYVLNHLTRYLDAIDGTSATIDANENFLVVIEDVLSIEAPRLKDVIERAASCCKVIDLTDVSEGAWPALAEDRRFPATFSNVSNYVMALGEVDEHLAKILTSTTKIADANSADEKSKAALAVAILTTANHLPSAALRAELVDSLGLEDYLSVDNITAEAGDLFAQLVKYNLIADDAVSYGHLAGTDWLTRKAFIRESHNFSSYMTPALIREDLAALLESSEIVSAVKNIVIEQAANYAEVADSRGLNELARFATKSGSELSPDVIQKMAEQNVSVQQIILLLKPHLDVISRDQLFTILQLLGGDYPKLTEVGRSRLHVPDTLADRELLKRLQRERTVSSYDVSKGMIEVNRKRKQG
ncbi:DNA-binding protein [Pseudomonas aeruginosa]|uniref:YobI family P-loop NTPase n=1 Tax=Pseudomonas aeruginosa TaxID=287 RepID=UPI000BACC2FA|nr:DNA-binding protein [Pseudomonas aeruginosa]AVZ32962.1 DNA-binding protein [Pseudomonas aeruginosa]PBL68052.1 DNA-binding protein [Pseudomonas aeruginosa]PBL77376.1 DNA-binding protein [Pseudomonas aeruginosa]PBL77755.1 DNA-binding protein [Pseudomonas aeruginosa]PBL87508.1 DNA-binding protein [Pseudomonas aeruginosa]